MKVSIALLSPANDNFKELSRWANFIDYYNHTEPKLCIFKRSVYK